VSEENEQPWLSIVTVVKDDPSGFEQTRLSVVNQSIKGFEWVVVDSSTVKLSDQGTDVYSWSEPNGVFPAMNVGLEICVGQRVLFLNAGDVLNEKETLEQIHGLSSDADKSAVLFGDVAFVSEDGLKIVVPPPLDFDFERSRQFSAGRFPPHQGVIAPRTLLLELGGFDESYKVASDYKTTLLLAERTTFKYMSLVITRFTLGGVSSQNWLASLREFHRARVEVFHLSGLSRVRSGLWASLQLLKMATVRIWRKFSV